VQKIALLHALFNEYAVAYKCMRKILKNTLKKAAVHAKLEGLR